jgi:gamma-D-glutamyl-L-lysine dipeptidyl-peptidase
VHSLMFIQEYCIFRCLIINSQILMKLVRLVKNFIHALFFIFFVAGCKLSVEKSVRAQMEIDSLAAIFIPDHRMGICEIKIQTGEEGVQILKGETTNPFVKDAIIKTLSKHGNKLIDSILILPDTLLNKNYCGLATLSVLNIRKQPDHTAEMVSQAILGTPLRILKKNESWLLVETPDHYIGWTESSSVEPMTASDIDKWKRSDRVITLVNYGSVYSSPDESGIIGDFVAGCIFIKEGDYQKYTVVRFPDGREGYIRSKSLMDFNCWRTNVKCTEANIVRCASTLIGLPYLWGGSSSKAVDCSGFSKIVYFLNGLILFRDASQQALHGLNVDITSGYEQMRPGDLLFFGSRENTKLHITHVGVYMGDYEYINSSGRVQINSLDSARSNYSSYKAKSLLTVKRIIGADEDPGIVSVNSHPWY